MAEANSFFNPADLPSDSIYGRLQLVAIGILVTVITQSSSAGVAAALTALYASAITFHQAAALVIGMDVGTTFTAAMAAIGGTLDARRTGLSHVVFNFMTAGVALFLINPFVIIWENLFSGELTRISHTSLNPAKHTGNF